MTGTLDRTRKLALELGRYVRNAPGQDFPLFVEKSLQRFRVFVVEYVLAYQINL